MRVRAPRTAPRWDVAIHAPLAGALYHADNRGWTGGAELQAHRIARALAEGGLRVAHIVSGARGIPPHRDGVDLVMQVPRTRALRGTRSALAIWDALARADASVYVQRSGDLATGLVGAFARARRRRFVYSFSSAMDLEPGPLLSVEVAGKRLGLRLADRVVTQTADQQEVAVRELGSKATLIRSFCEPISVEVEPQSFLWIGGLIDYKDPLAYLELAQRVPEARFVMVATPRAGWERLAQEVANRAPLLPNLVLVSPRPRSELVGLYARTVAVVGTSAFEGFPNTFLDAWACGIPALSLSVDPDGVIERHGLGAVANGTVEALAELARSYWSRRGDLPEGVAAKKYVSREHDPAVVGNAWMDLIGGLLVPQRESSSAEGY